MPIIPSWPPWSIYDGDDRGNRLGRHQGHRPGALAHGANGRVRRLAGLRGEGRPGRRSGFPPNFRPWGAEPLVRGHAPRRAHFPPTTTTATRRNSHPATRYACATAACSSKEIVTQSRLVCQYQVSQIDRRTRNRRKTKPGGAPEYLSNSRAPPVAVTSTGKRAGVRVRAPSGRWIGASRRPSRFHSALPPR